MSRHDWQQGGRYGGNQGGGYGQWAENHAGGYGGYGGYYGGGGYMQAGAQQYAKRYGLPDTPKVRFDPLAYCKYMYFSHLGSSEVGGFGRHTRVGNTITIVDFITVLHRNTNGGFCDFEPEARMRLMMELAEQQVEPASVLRCWMHTHPGDSFTPSGEDWDTFAQYHHPDHGNNFPYALMVILGKNGDVGCHMALSTFRAGSPEKTVDNPGMNVVLEIDVEVPTKIELLRVGDQVTAQRAAWDAEYEKNVKPGQSSYTWVSAKSNPPANVPLREGPGANGSAGAVGGTGLVLPSNTGRSVNDRWDSTFAGAEGGHIATTQEAWDGLAPDNDPRAQAAALNAEYTARFNAAMAAIERPGP